jgi:hypothetical protein
MDIEYNPDDSNCVYSEKIECQCPDCKNVFEHMSFGFSVEEVFSRIEFDEDNMGYFVPLEKNKNGYYMAQCDDCSVKEMIQKEKNI